MLPCTDCSESLQASREIRPNIIHSSSLSHHLLYPNFVEFQGPFTSCQPVVYCLCPFSSVCLHAFHILPNHHRFQLAAGLPCALSAELLACFVSSCPRRLARPARRHKRRVAAPLAADRQQATQRVQTSKETRTRAGGWVAYSIPLNRKLQGLSLICSRQLYCQTRSCAAQKLFPTCSH